MLAALKEIVGYRDLLLNLAATELKLRYRNNVLGFLWTVLNPLFYLLILAVVFSKILRFELENYAIFLFAGLTSWLMLQQTVIIATASIVNNQALIKRIYIPKLVFPLSNVLARFVDHIVLTAILLIFMAVFGARFSPALLFLPAAVLLHFLFTLGLSLLTSVACIKVRDVQQITAVAFQALFYATPIIYSLDLLPQAYRPVFLLNPFYYFVETLRYPVYYAALPPWDILLVAILLAVLTCAAGFHLFSRTEKYFVFHLS